MLQETNARLFLIINFIPRMKGCITYAGNTMKEQSTDQAGIAVILFTCIWQVLGLNLDWAPGYTDLKFFVVFSASPGKFWDRHKDSPFIRYGPHRK
jgi:hypothetical protein